MIRLGRSFSPFGCAVGCLVAGGALVPMSSADVIVDDFEGYADTAELLGAWASLVSGQPVIALVAAPDASGGRAISLEASPEGGPVDVALRLFASARDWSGASGLEMRVAQASGSPGAATVQVVVSTPGNVTLVIGPEVVVPSTGWAKYELPFDGVDVASVGRLSVAVRPTGGVDATVLVDDISLSLRPVRFDVADTAQPLLGFGAQLWPDDIGGRQAFNALGLKWMRMAFGPNWDALVEQPPIEATFEEMLTYVTNNFNGDFSSRLSGAVSTMQWADSAGVSVILNQFKIPDAWLTSGDRLRESNVDEFAEYWAAVLTLFESHGVRPEYVELANEPNGTWNGRIPPARYAALVKAARQELDEAGFSDVGIVGPGLSEMRLNDDYFNAMDAQAASAIAAWSTHTWDDWADWDARYGVFASGIDRFDPGGTKPVFATEYATSIDEFGGIAYDDNDEGGNNPASETHEYTIEVALNTVRLLNSGVGAPIYWQASDQPWSSSTWGFLDQTDSYRDVASALFPLLNAATDSSVVLTNSNQDRSVAAFVHRENDSMERIALASVNRGMSARSRTFVIENALVESIADAWLYTENGLSNIRSGLSFGEDGSLTFDQEGDSVFSATIRVREPAPCIADFDLNMMSDFMDVLVATDLAVIGDESIDRVSPAGITEFDFRAALDAIEEGCPD